MSLENKPGGHEGVADEKAQKIIEHFRPLDALGDGERPHAFREKIIGYKKDHGAVDFAEIETGLRSDEAVQLHLLAVDREIAEKANPGHRVSDVNDFDPDKITPRSYAVTTRLGLEATQRAAEELRFPYVPEVNLRKLADAGFLKKDPAYGPKKVQEKVERRPHR